MQKDPAQQCLRIRMERRRAHRTVRFGINRDSDGYMVGICSLDQRSLSSTRRLESRNTCSTSNCALGLRIPCKFATIPDQPRK